MLVFPRLQRRFGARALYMAAFVVTVGARLRGSTHGRGRPRAPAHQHSTNAPQYARTHSSARARAVARKAAHMPARTHKQQSARPRAGSGTLTQRTSDAHGKWTGAVSAR